jgi:hypothetical protein
VPVLTSSGSSQHYTAITVLDLCTSALLSYKQTGEPVGKQAVQTMVGHQNLRAKLMTRISQLTQVHQHTALSALSIADV